MRKRSHSALCHLRALTPSLLVGFAILLAQSAAEGQTKALKHGIADSEMRAFEQTGELSADDAARIRDTRRGTWDDRLAAVQQLLSEKRMPEDIARKLTFKEADLHLCKGDPVTAKGILEEWLAHHPDDPEEIELRASIVGILMHNNGKLKLTADQRMKQVKATMDPISRRYTEEHLAALQARIMRAKAIRTLGREMASEWQRSPAGRARSPELSELRVCQIEREHTLDAERELLAVQTVLKRMCGPDKGKDPADQTSPDQENPVVNILRGVEHELRRTAILRNHVEEKAAKLTEITTRKAVDAVFDDALKPQ